MKASHTLLLVLISSTAIYAQDNPATAIDLFHTWSAVEMTEYTFEGTTDDPTSLAEGPDLWFTFEATQPTVVYGYTDDAAWGQDEYQFELFDYQLVSLGVEIDYGSWSDLIVGDEYYISVTRIAEDIPQCFFFAIADDGYGYTGDLNNDGLVAMNDLLFFLAQYGSEGKLDQDYDLSGFVDTPDLLIQLTVTGSAVAFTSCE